MLRLTDALQLKLYKSGYNLTLMPHNFGRPPGSCEPRPGLRRQPSQVRIPLAAKLYGRARAFVLTYVMDDSKL